MNPHPISEAGFGCGRHIERLGLHLSSHWFSVVLKKNVGIFLVNGGPYIGRARMRPRCKLRRWCRGHVLVQTLSLE